MYPGKNDFTPPVAYLSAPRLPFPLRQRSSQSACATYVAGPKWLVRLSYGESGGGLGLSLATLLFHQALALAPPRLSLFMHLFYS